MRWLIGYVILRQSDVIVTYVIGCFFRLWNLGHGSHMFKTLNRCIKNKIAVDKSTRKHENKTDYKFEKAGIVRESSRAIKYSSTV